MKHIENIRDDYNLGILDETKFDSSPMMQFKVWFREVVDVVLEPTAMFLSTYDIHHGVNNRIVLLKEILRDGFVFYTNYNSLKARQIASNPNVALCFFWPTLQRQVRINGVAVKTSHTKSVEYFKKRPRKSQISAWASEQSKVLNNRLDLESNYIYYDKKFKDKIIPKPVYWGGYKIKPHLIEFWQGRENRLHDRIVYIKKNRNWTMSRLAP